MKDRQDSYHRSFVAMRNALRSILFHNGDCYRYDAPLQADRLCECPVCIAKAALESEEDWRFMGHSPERRASMPRELAIVEAWKHYFKRSGGKANGTSSPLDGMLAQILGTNADSISERDWYVATTIVQWLATGVGQCVLFDAGYAHKPKTEETPPDKNSDSCRFCLGTKGGTPGNENLFNDVVVCDYCTALLMKARPAHAALTAERDQLKAEVERLRNEIAASSRQPPMTATASLQLSCTGTLVHDEFTPCPVHDARPPKPAK